MIFDECFGLEECPAGLSFWICGGSGVGWDVLPELLESEFVVLAALGVAVGLVLGGDAGHPDDAVLVELSEGYRSGLSGGLIGLLGR